MSVLKTFSLTVVLALTTLTAQAESPEALLGYTYDDQGITFQVSSGGCTKKKDFTLYQRESWPVQLELVRHTFDMCEAVVPAGTKITFTWSELGVRDHFQFVVTNPMGVGSVYPLPTQK